MHSDLLPRTSVWAFLILYALNNNNRRMLLRLGYKEVIKIKKDFKMSFAMPDRMEMKVMHDWIYNNLYEASSDIQLAAFHEIGPLFWKDNILTGRLTVQSTVDIELSTIQEMLGEPPIGITHFKVEE